MRNDISVGINSESQRASMRLPLDALEKLMEGDRETQAEIAFMIAQEFYENHHETEAVRWWQKAAEKGHVLATYNLGVTYDKGMGGLPKDKSKAVEWWQKAAEKGVVEAMYNLGYAYLKGADGLPKDEPKAIEWWQKAAENEHASAMEKVAIAYYFGKNGLPKDEEKAVKWWQKAAEKGKADAMFNLGVAHAEGLGGLPKDEAQAVEWWQRTLVHPDASDDLKAHTREYLDKLLKSQEENLQEGTGAHGKRVKTRRTQAKAGEKDGRT
jgi:TPR repeat protein